MIALKKNAVAYAATTFASSMMHSMFMFYYVKIYVNYFHVSNEWFQASQVIFMVWNAFNDPLFGYVQDHPSYNWLRSRRLCILYGAPLFAITFVLPWFPWGDYTTGPSWLAGVQLMVCLCLYDALYTFVLLAQCALFAEMSTLHEDRITLIRYSQFAGLLGSSSVFFSEYISSNLEEFGRFQIFTVVVGVIAWRAMVYSGNNVSSPRDPKDGARKSSDEQEMIKSATEEQALPWWKLILQIVRNVSFIGFVLVNFLQIYHMSYLNNFTSIFCDQLIPKNFISSATRSVVYGAMFIAPQVMVILFSPAVAKIGYYRIVRYSFVVRLCAAIFFYVAGPDPFRIMAYFLIDSMLTMGVFSLFNLCLSDIVDEDLQKNKRKSPVSSLIFGTNALITKPAISVSPMITLGILESYGYKQLKDDAAPPSSTDLVDLHMAMFAVICCTPVVISVLQLGAWTLYRIRDSHTVVAKHIET